MTIFDFWPKHWISLKKSISNTRKIKEYQWIEEDHGKYGTFCVYIVSIIGFVLQNLLKTLELIYQFIRLATISITIMIISYGLYLFILYLKFLCVRYGPIFWPTLISSIMTIFAGFIPVIFTKTNHDA